MAVLTWGANTRKGLATAHTSGHDSSQYTFAHIGVQATMCDNHPKRATDQTGQHGWQSALMTSMMWLSNVVGEYLTQAGPETGGCACALASVD